MYYRIKIRLGVTWYYLCLQIPEKWPMPYSWIWSTDRARAFVTPALDLATKLVRNVAPPMEDTGIQRAIETESRTGEIQDCYL